MSIINFIIKKTYNFLLRKFLKRGYKLQEFNGINERLIEYKFLFNVLGGLGGLIDTPKKILDVGSGTSPLPAVLRLCGFEVTAIDNVKDYWKNSFINNHYYVINDDITNTKLNAQFDVITCISTLEHINDYMLAIKNIWKLLKPGGSLILTFPYNREKYVRNVYDFEECSIHPKEFICQLFSNKDIHRMIRNRFKILKEERWKCFSGKYWRCGERYDKPKLEPLIGNPDLICLWWKK